MAFFAKPYIKQTSEITALRSAKVTAKGGFQRFDIKTSHISFDKLSDICYNETAKRTI